MFFIQICIHDIFYSAKMRKNATKITQGLVFCLFVCLFSPFLWLHLQYKEVPGLGDELELQLPAYTTATATPDLSHICNLHLTFRQCRILNSLSKARDQTHILMDTSWLLNQLSHNGKSKQYCIFFSLLNYHFNDVSKLEMRSKESKRH